MDIIFCRGGNKHAPTVAEKSGMKYGIRHDSKAYGDVYFMDINWKKYDWDKYIEKVQALNPVMAMTPDYESPEQRRNLYKCIRDLKTKTNVQRIMVCPKFHGAIAHIPSFCIAALSAPAPTYATFLPDLIECKGRRIHLLGSNPHTQLDLITKLNGIGADVISVDGNYLSVKAANGQYFKYGRWVQTSNVPTTELESISAQNIYKYLMANKDRIQYSLFAA